MWQGIIVDIAFVIMLAVAAYYGYKNGAIKVILSLLIIVLVIPIVYLTYEPVTNFVIKNTSIYDTINSSVYLTLESKNINETGKLEEDEEYLPILTKKINEFITKAKDEYYNNLVEKVSQEVATFIVQIIVIVVWSIILYAFLTVFKLIIVKIVDLIPVMNVINYVSGSILQVVKVTAIVFIILYVLQFILPIVEIALIQDNIERTTIIKYMYNNNIINKFIN